MISNFKDKFVIYLIKTGSDEKVANWNQDLVQDFCWNA
jgi:hypothetical protein